MNKKIVKTINIMLIVVIICFALFLVLPKLSAEETNYNFITNNDVNLISSDLSMSESISTANKLEIEINGKTFCDDYSDSDDYSEAIELDKPLKIKLSYEAERELPSMLFLEKTDGSEDKAIFYPILKDVSPKLSDMSPMIYRYSYEVMLYKNVVVGGTNTYKLRYTVYGVDEDNKISYSNKKNKLIKAYFASSPKIPLVPQKDILEFFNLQYYPQNFKISPRQLVSHNINNKLKISKDQLVKENKEYPNKLSIMPEKSLKKEINIQGINKKIKLVTSNSKIKDADNKKQQNLIVSQKQENKPQEIYIQNMGNTKKLISIEAILKEQNINPNMIVGDINISNIDNIAKYKFQLKKQRKLFGFIPIGYKTEMREINATESIK